MTTTQVTTKDYFAKPAVVKKFNELLGNRSTQFITSVLQVVNSNRLLQNATPDSVYTAAATAAILDLPINQNLGFAWIVPYKGNAQFQIGWKGLVQLAQRTGQYKHINVIEVYDNQFKSYNTLTEELDADFSLDGDGKVIGYVAYFKLKNGFEKTDYWSVEKVKAHALKYSQAYKSASGVSPWKDADQFHAMAKKTVLKNCLSKWGILSVEIQTATIADQAVIKDVDTMDVNYIDNELEAVNKEAERIELLIQNCNNKAELMNLRESFIMDEVVLTSEQNAMIETRLETFKG